MYRTRTGIPCLFVSQFCFRSTTNVQLNWKWTLWCGCASEGCGCIGEGCGCIGEECGCTGEGCGCTGDEYVIGNIYPLYSMQERRCLTDDYYRQYQWYTATM